MEATGSFFLYHFLNNGKLNHFGTVTGYNLRAKLLRQEKIVQIMLHYAAFHLGPLFAKVSV